MKTCVRPEVAYIDRSVRAAAPSRCSMSRITIGAYAAGCVVCRGFAFPPTLAPPLFCLAGRFFLKSCAQVAARHGRSPIAKLFYKVRFFSVLAFAHSLENLLSLWEHYAIAYFHKMLEIRT